MFVHAMKKDHSAFDIFSCCVKHTANNPTCKDSQNKQFKFFFTLELWWPEGDWLQLHNEDDGREEGSTHILPSRGNQKDCSW